jgi:hypothetical protein
VQFSSVTGEGRFATDRPRGRDRPNRTPRRKTIRRLRAADDGRRQNTLGSVGALQCLESRDGFRVHPDGRGIVQRFGAESLLHHVEALYEELLEERGLIPEAWSLPIEKRLAA